MSANGRKYYFLTICNVRNITKAADILCVSQPSLSQYLNHLESELNARLFDRATNPLQLTEAGRIYEKYLTAAQKLEQNMLEDLEALRNGTSRLLTVGVPMQMTHNINESVIKNLDRIKLSREINLEERTSPEVKEMVENGEIEVGLGHTLLDDDIDNVDIVIEPMYREKVLLVCSKKSKYAAGRESDMDHPLQLSLQQMREASIYITSTHHIMYRAARQYLDMFGVRPRQEYMLSNFRVTAEIMASKKTDVLAFMPAFILEDADFRDDIAYLTLGQDYYMNFSLMHKDITGLSYEAKAFCSEVRRIYSTRKNISHT